MDTRTIKNYAYNLSYQILLVLAPLITTPYVSRVLQADGVGTYSYTQGIAAAFTLFAALGANIYGQREVACKQDDVEARSRLFWELFFFRLLTTFAVVMAYLVFCFLYDDYRVYLLINTMIIVSTALDLSWFFQGMEDFKAVAIRNVIIKIFTIVGIFLFVKNYEDLWVYVLINAISGVVGGLALFPSLRKVVAKVDFSTIHIGRHLKGCLEFFVPLVATQIYSQLDTVMLGAILNDPFENGYYSQSRKIIQILLLVATSLNTVMMSRVSKLCADRDFSKAKETMSESFKVILLVTTPLMVGTLLVSDNLTDWFFGPGYEKVAFLIKLSVPLLFLMAIGNFVGNQYLIPTNQQNTMTKIYIMAAIVNVALNSVMILLFASVGAMLASIAAEAVSCGLQVALLIRSSYSFNMLEGSWRYAISALVMGFAIVIVQISFGLTGVTETCLELGTGVLVYSVSLLAFKDPMALALLRRLR